FPVYGCRAGAWRPVERCPCPTLRLSVATWNVLSDRHDPEKTHPDQRRPLLLDELRRAGADILCLQEVTPAFWDELLEQSWVRAGYVSEPPGGAALRPHGNAILSRWPFTLAARAFTAPWRVLVGTWQLGGQPLHVAAVHLPSDRAQDGPAERERQLSWL